MMTLAALLLSGLIASCATTKPVPLPECPRPDVPEMPILDAEIPLEHPLNMQRLMERDDCLRFYIEGLESALDCYKKTGGT